MARDPLDIHDHLEASSDASKRTRNITVVLVIACVLVSARIPVPDEQETQVDQSGRFSLSVRAGEVGVWFYSANN